MHATSIVGTSINPRGRLDHQLACFHRWRELGANCRSFNVAEERALLLEAGLTSSEVVELDDVESMRPLTGRSNPLVLPVLQRLRNSGATTVMLVNADIFPAASRNPVPLMASHGDAAGWVRTDCVSVDQPEDAPRWPYHNGLDVFAFSQLGVDAVLARLSRYAASDRMAFGVPGWDLLLGHCILAEGGDLLEAPFLLHPRHPASYDSIEPFAPMAHVMLASGRYSSHGHVDLAAEFVRLIGSRCQANIARSRVLALAVGAYPTTPATSAMHEPAAEGVDELARLLPGPDSRELLLQQLLRPDWQALHLLYRRLETSTTVLDAYLRAMQGAVKLRRATRRGRWTTIYPATQSHHRQLRHQIAKVDTVARRHGILEMFATEFYEYGVLNFNLFKYLLTQCVHETEQRRCISLLREIRRAPDCHDDFAAAD